MRKDVLAHLHICPICDATFDCMREACLNTLAVHCAVCEPQPEPHEDQVVHHA